MNLPLRASLVFAASPEDFFPLVSVDLIDEVVLFDDASHTVRGLHASVLGCSVSLHLFFADSSNTSYGI